MASAAQQSQLPLAISVTGVCDLSQRTYFVQHVVSGQSFSFVNRPVDVTKWELEVFLAGGTLTWPSNVKWVGGFAPQLLQVGKYQRFFFEISQISPEMIMGSYLPNF